MIAGLLGISCRQADVLPDNVRTAAGKNGQELQRVLDHYENDPLKQRAAMYLLENMPGHYTATSKLFASHRKRTCFIVYAQSLVERTWKETDG